MCLVDRKILVIFLTDFVIVVLIVMFFTFITLCRTFHYSMKKGFKINN